MGEAILVTGATGFVGASVVSHLAERGHDVVAVSQRGGRVRDIPVAAVDLRDRRAAFGELAHLDCDAVVHLAAAIPDDAGAEAMQASFDATTAADATVAAFCRSRRCGVVYASGTSVYGSTGVERAADEATLPRPETAYTAAKAAGEIVFLQLGRELGLPASALRISAPYGAGNRRRTVVEIFLRAALDSSELTLQGSGGRTQDFTYVDDVAEAVEAALVRKASGIFNVATGRPVSMHGLAEAVLAAVPSSTSRIVHTGRPDPQEEHRTFVDVARARSELGWSARHTLVEGLRATVAALRSGA